jgi:hypothetical protein
MTLSLLILALLAVLVYFGAMAWIIKKALDYEMTIVEEIDNNKINHYKEHLNIHYNSE